MRSAQVWGLGFGAGVLVEKVFDERVVPLAGGFMDGGVRVCDFGEGYSIRSSACDRIM